jgi:CheY-like chemotaxis protein
MSSEVAEPKARLLIVEDEETNREMLATYLERSGYEVRTAADGEAGLTLARREPFDLVLLDVMMPGLSGTEVLSALREDHSPKQLPVIMVTARSAPGEQVEALRAGANDWVIKPYDLKLLLARVEARLWIDREPASSVGAREEKGPAQPGRVLDGRWRIEESIGRGGDGDVYRATHIALDRKVAVKVLRLGGDDASALERFREEGALACRVDHPNAVDVLDFGVTEDQHAYLVMGLLSGINLAMELHLKKRLEPLRCLEILRPVGAALAEAHDLAIVHRDIKPANIFLHRTKQGEVVKVLDFGIARFTDPDGGGDRPSSGLVGTLSYAAPERLRRKIVDGRADIYSLGTVLYEMLTGAPPFDTLEHDEPTVARMQLHTPAPSVLDARPDLPAALDDLIARALAKDPRHRPDARGFVAELERAVGV